jgi:unsaturated rhamnogalacturonyl hydrolase
VELKYFNELTKVFGVQFSNKNRNMVQNNQFEQGKIITPENHIFLKTAKTLYIKEFCTLLLEKPAQANLIDKGDVLIATTKYGKGMVLIVVDPWFYNEYVNGKKLPAEFDNFKAMQEMSVWLLNKAKK